jgi:hypothetical protein
MDMSFGASGRADPAQLMTTATIETFQIRNSRSRDGSAYR